MRQSAFLIGIIVFLAGTAGAQSRLDDGVAAADLSSANGAVVSQESSKPQVFAMAAAEPLNFAPAATSADPSAPQGPPPQLGRNEVQSVFPQYDWQAYAGYGFVHFYETPGLSPNLNGFNLAIDYYRHAGPLAIDGEMVAVFGSQAHHTAELWAGMGGGRYRFAAPRGLEVWVHGLIGGAKYVPQTALGSQTGLAYEVGAGVDVGAWNHRLAFRFAGDLLGTRFFSTGQYSPKVSAGIVFKY
jgi:hypothetical protein